MKTALITGVTGQDGSYLVPFLLGKGYRVVAMMRRVSTEPPFRFRQPQVEEAYKSGQLILTPGDLVDRTSIEVALSTYRPDEIYNLAAQSHVGISFNQPEETMRVNLFGPLNLIEAVKILRLDTKIYQASTSEMFGDSARSIMPQDETTPMMPASPYGIAKLAAHNLMHLARTAEHAFPVRTACGILFNHESPYRGEDFVTRKITKAVARIYAGKQEILELGNLDSKRDWGFAGDYVKAMWMMMQQEGSAHEWQDFVVATGVQHSVREFVEAAFKVVGWQVEWKGSGPEEEGCVNGILRVQVNRNYYRDKDVWTLVGNPAKALQKLGWRPETSFDQLVEMMVKADLASEQSKIAEPVLVD
jgi:GDPmannose 4,6-dehydratase